MFTLKKVPRRHICSVNGCRNRNAMLITRSADYTRGIWLCADCIRDAYAAMAAQAESEKEAEMTEDSAEKKEEAPKEAPKGEIIVQRKRGR